MSFNSLLSLCTKDSIGCASRRQRGIYRSQRQPLAAPQEHLARSSRGQGPHRLTPMVLLGSGGEGPAGPGIRNLPLNSWSPCRNHVFLWLPEEILETSTTGENGCCCHSADTWKMTIILQESPVLLVICLGNHQKVVDFKIQLGSENLAGHTSFPLYCPWHPFNCQQDFWSTSFSGSFTNPSFSWTDGHFWAKNSTIYGLFKQEHKEFLLE